MARPLRVEYPGAWLHVMNRGAGRRIVFPSEALRRVFYSLLCEASKIFGLEIHAFCLMGNHYHLLVRIPQPCLADAMRHLNGVYTQAFNRLGDTDGPLFRGRYHAILVSEDDYLTRVSRYIHLNPVEAGMVMRPEDYPHSSYRSYLAPGTGFPWLHVSTVLGLFGPDTAVVRYRRFVEQGMDLETLEFFRKQRRPPVFGGEEFRLDRQRLVARRAEHTEIPDARKFSQRPELHTISRAVAIVVGIEEARVLQGSGCGLGTARGLCVYVARYDGGYPLRTIADWLGYRNYRGAASGLRQIRKRLEADALLRDVLSAVRREIGVKSRLTPKASNET